MKAIGLFFSRLFEDQSTRIDPTYRQWDKLRSEALTPSHRAEIDAIFSRSV